MARSGPASAYTDISEAREHLRRLIASGVSRPAIASLSGLSVGTLREYERERPTSAGAPPKALIHRLSARRILSITDTHVAGSTRFVSATPTIRRLQALVVAGYSRRMISDQLGIPHLRGGLDRSTVLASTESALADFYEQHAYIEPSYRSATQRGHAREAQAEAEALGWLGPWDWGDIGAGVLLWHDAPEEPSRDVPSVTSETNRVPCGEVRPHIRALLSRGWTRAEVASAAAVDGETIRAALGEKLVRGRETRSIRRANAERILAIPLGATRAAERMAA